MPTEVKMPQMGESIYEGTITKWLKKAGDDVAKDEPLYELSTDKVDTEIPSPVSGRLEKIAVAAGKKVPIHTVVCWVEEGAPAAAPPSGVGGVVAGMPPVAPEQEPAAPPPAGEKPAPPPAPAKPVPEPAAPSAPSEHGGDGERVFASPLVRKIAREENVDLSQIQGTGGGGRITKEDILAYVESRKAGPAIAARPAAAPALAPAAAPPSEVAGAMAGRPAAGAAPAKPAIGRPGEVVPMSPMRAKIAEHMVMSKRTSAHVHTVFEVDLSKIWALREREKDDYERVYSLKLTFTTFFAAAAAEAIKEFPTLNSSVNGTNIILKREIHLGIAVALPDGLIVPVVKNVEEKSFLGLQRAISDVAERARLKKLTLDDVQGGTFTITNPGIYGGLFGTPIINQPQVAILGVGGIEKRPVVIDDAIAIRPMCHLVLGFDHRVIDGAVADQFMAKVKNVLQNWSLPIK
ncbi:MAG: 2-oxo acid dehydrogenase subunit E2 [Planctomycetes bacterium]|nr:2-oxo acid dehydrogenase subunit E2 [Planctomycetota bacterium]